MQLVFDLFVEFRGEGRGFVSARLVDQSTACNAIYPKLSQRILRSLSLCLSLLVVAVHMRLFALGEESRTQAEREIAYLCQGLCQASFHNVIFSAAEA